MTVVVIDGELVPPEAATISVFDRGLLFGDGCFEVLRTWLGVAVDLDAHLDRLLDTATSLALATRPRDAIAADVRRALGAAGEGEHRIRIVLTRGAGGLATRMAALGPGRTIVIVEPLGAPPAELTVAVVDWPVAAHPGRGHKTLAYLDHLRALELARAVGADEAIRLDPAGAVVEGATCNLFLVDDAGMIATPPAERGVLPGIVRGRVLDWCARDGLVVRVRPVAVDELDLAVEVFVTSSLRGVVGVRQIGDRKIPIGPITTRISAGYVKDLIAAARSRNDGRDPAG